MTELEEKARKIIELEVANGALVDKLQDLSRRKMARNGEAALKWRGQAFYWKSKYKSLLQNEDKQCPTS